MRARATGVWRVELTGAGWTGTERGCTHAVTPSYWMVSLGEDPDYSAQDKLAAAVKALAGVAQIREVSGIPRLKSDRINITPAMVSVWVGDVRITAAARFLIWLAKRRRLS